MEKLAILHAIRKGDSLKIVLKNYIDSKLKDEYTCENVKNVVIIGNEPYKLYMPMGMDYRFTTIVFPEKNVKLSCSDIEAKVLL
ncbi:MAG TPA: hypothetical protein EYP08_04905 [Pyrodictiaceae archaeon]|nr:hypothetical protein [Pyrodictiaceae archaeon]